MSEEKIYTLEIQGQPREYFVNPTVTVVQDTKVMGLIGKLGLGGLVGLGQVMLAKMKGETIDEIDIALEQHLSNIAEHDLIAELLAIALTPVSGQFEVEKIPEVKQAVQLMPRSQYWEVLHDFLPLVSAPIGAWLSSLQVALLDRATKLATELAAKLSSSLSAPAGKASSTTRSRRGKPN